MNIYHRIDTLDKFEVSYSIDPVTKSLMLDNIIVNQEYRNNGIGKKIIYTFFSICNLYKLDYFIIKVISPIIETFIHNYYTYEKIKVNDYKINGLSDIDYSESILPIFLQINQDIQFNKM